jgi:hypothetical protein
MLSRHSAAAQDEHLSNALQECLKRVWIVQHALSELLNGDKKAVLKQIV